MVYVYPTLNMNGLKILIKRLNLYKQLCEVYKKTTLKYKDSNRLKVKR